MTTPFYNVHILDLLRSSEAWNHVDRALHAIHDTSEITPSTVQRIRTQSDPIWHDSLPLLIDLVQGARRAVALGKAQPGWLFTTTTVQQATLPEIAAYHAQAFIGCTHVVEVCTGAGIDAAALARVVDRVTTFEADPLVAALAHGNLHRAGLQGVTVVPEAVPGGTYLEALQSADGLWADPSRRNTTGRHRTTQSYEPPLSLLLHLPAHLRTVGIKTGPADRSESPLPADMHVEFIGWQRECRERLLWRGAASDRVTLVDQQAQWLPNHDSTPPAACAPSDAMVLIEPHPAIMASGWVSSFFAHLHALVIDHRIGYGLLNVDTGPSPLYSRFRLLHV